MPASYLLDSDVCIRALSKRGGWLMSLLNAMRHDGLAISVITYGEVTEGALYSRHRAVHLQRWRDFSRAFDVISVTPDIAEIWADIRGGLRRRGEVTPDNDLLIAATALYFDMRVVTFNNRHFSRVGGLAVDVPDAELETVLEPPQ